MIPIWKSEVSTHGKNIFIPSFLMRKEGKRVKRWWFNSKARELLKEKYPDKASIFKSLHRCFKRLYRRHKKSLRRKTHAAQKLPAALRTTIENFHAKFLDERKRELTLLKTWQTWTKHHCLWLRIQYNV